MRLLRQRLSWIVCAWLIAQASTIAVVSASACAETAEATTAVVCTCTHADGAECPMHHARTTPKPRCSCRSADEGAASTALAMFIFAAVLPPSHGAPLPAPAAGVAAAALDRLFDHAFVPDPPPPRRSLC